MDYKTEEDVKIKFLIPYLKSLGYKESQCEFEKSIEVHEGRKSKKIYADVIIYTSSKKDAPLILCETKSPNEILNRSVKEQAISYARLLPKIAPLVLITNGYQTQVFQSLNKNRIHELPHRRKLQKDIVDVLISKELQNALRAEAKHELFIIDDVQSFKSILKFCHNEIRNNEGYDPTVAFDEMSKVLFCKLYEEKHSQSNRFRSSVFNETLNNLGVNVVKQIFEETKNDKRYSGLFTKEVLINLQDITIKKIINIFENFDLSLTAFDVKGEAFEYFLSDTFTGGLGEFFTPRNIVEFIVDAINPKIGEKIIDPFCGTGGFLIYAFDVVKEKIRLQEFSEEEKNRWQIELSNRSLFGTDWKERTSQACKMNMMVHGDGSSGIFMHHGLVDVDGYIEENKFDICLTNPPFGSFENDPDILANYELGAGRKSQSRVILALERAIRLIKPNGLIGIVVIDGILNNLTTKYVRNYIKQNTWIKGIISLAKETFQGYNARAKTSVLLLQKKVTPDEGEQESIFMAIANNTGYAPNGDQIAGNELPDIHLAFNAFLNGKSDLVNFNNCFICKCDDRLDAEFYASRNIKYAEFNINSIETDVSEILNKITTEYSILQKEIKTAFQDQEYKSYELSQLLKEINIREEVKPENNYTLLGVRWWGGGAFIREEKIGKEIKGKYLYKVKDGWIIYNRLFAFRGSFAVLENIHNGCYVSNEFPTFEANSSIDSPEIMCRYIVHCLNSPKYLDIVDSLSTGSTKTSRNRFNQKQFLKFKIDIPNKEEGLVKIVSLLDRATMLRFTHEKLIEKMKDLHEGISMMLPISS